MKTMSIGRLRCSGRRCSKIGSLATQEDLGHSAPLGRLQEARRRELTGNRWKLATGSGVGVGRVKLKLQNQVEKHHEPLAKLRAEGIKEQVTGALANHRRVGVAQKRSRGRHDGEEAKWSGKRTKEALAPRRSGVGDKTMGIYGWWPSATYDHNRITAHGIARARVTGVDG
jgi:hypothetical protein